ncbi:MAG: hypothetical protein AAGD22_00040 [Verrucomicrobiota bacterium]
MKLTEDEIELLKSPMADTKACEDLARKIESILQEDELADAQMVCCEYSPFGKTKRKRMSAQKCRTLLGSIVDDSKCDN